VADFEFPADLVYTKEDEWARVEGDRVLIGVTDYAQQQLGDVVYIELPAVGTSVERGDPFGVIESVKAVSDLYAPVSGEVVDVNPDLAERPELVNEDCYGDGWMIAIAMTDPRDLEQHLDSKAYAAHVAARKS
jgi:glycine cleavage system H protein